MKYPVIIGSFLFMISSLLAFDTETLSKQWRWINEEPSEWQLTDDGALRLRTQFGRIWGGTGTKNILATKKVLGETADIEVTVTLEDPAEKWEQAGLLVYIDDDNFVKFIAEYIDGQMYVVMAHELERRGAVTSKEPIDSKTVRLRFEVSGSQVKGLWKLKSSDSEWREAAICEFPEASKAQRYFALFTQNGPENEVRWARMEEERLAID
tara:strand:- start:4071 stop:4700 length:630 start_codon:yes stop_codon:yes gene_type:complete